MTTISLPKPFHNPPFFFLNTKARHCWLPRQLTQSARTFGAVKTDSPRPSKRMERSTSEGFRFHPSKRGRGQATAGRTWRIIPVSKWIITMVIVSPLSRVVLLPNGLNGPNGLETNLQGIKMVPTLGSSENHRLKMPVLGGYVSSLEGNSSLPWRVTVHSHWFSGTSCLF